MEHLGGNGARGLGAGAAVRAPFQVALYGVHFVGLQRAERVGIQKIINVSLLHINSTQSLYPSGHQQFTQMLHPRADAALDRPERIA